jgi:chemotaxis protein histidine kinase CheA
LDTASQQRILGYFIEEAKEHLQTLEQGILQLASGSNDAEMVNEMFRAAHSVKGGAAMLGYTSIQKTAHRLEDSFKVLKDNSIAFDLKLESLFLAGYDFLQDLIERLENSSSFRDEDAMEIMEKVDANFSLLQNYLNELMSGVKSPAVASAAMPKPVAAPPSPAPVAVNITEQVKNVLKNMLQLFKQKDTPENRQALDRLCLNLARLAPNQSNWQNLVKCAQAAIANSKHAYSVLAPIVIKELKLGSDYLQSGQLQYISPSQSLKELAAITTPTASASVSQVVLPVEPRAAAAVLLKAFNREQLSQLMQILKANL